MGCTSSTPSQSAAANNKPAEVSGGAVTSKDTRGKPQEPGSSPSPTVISAASQQVNQESTEPLGSPTLSVKADVQGNETSGAPARDSTPRSSVEILESESEVISMAYDTAAPSQASPVVSIAADGGALKTVSFNEHVVEEEFAPTSQLVQIELPQETIAPLRDAKRQEKSKQFASFRQSSLTPKKLRFMPTLTEETSELAPIEEEAEQEPVDDVRVLDPVRVSEYDYFNQEGEPEASEAYIVPTKKFKVLQHGTLLASEAIAEKKTAPPPKVFRAPSMIRAATRKISSSFLGSMLLSEDSDMDSGAPSILSYPSPNWSQSKSIGGRGMVHVSRALSSTRFDSFSPVVDPRSNFMTKMKSVRGPEVRQELVKVDEVTEHCSSCNKVSKLGLFCMSSEHFVCQLCLTPYVEKLCTDTRQLKEQQFAVYCPIEGCQCPAWNSYHLCKVLQGRVLEMYIDTLIKQCQEEKSGARSPLQRSASTIAALYKLEETIKILKSQLLHLGVAPAEFIPLDELNAELASIFAKVNNGEEYDEGRLDFLLVCLDNNPDYVAQKVAEEQEFRESIRTFSQECLETMRGFVPPHIFIASLASLTQEDHMPVDMAKRFLTKKCLWLIRLDPDNINTIHEVELMNRFNFEAQGLDIVELAAIYAALPEEFTCDPSGKKTLWRRSLEQTLKKYDVDRRNNKLERNKQRNAVYKNRQPAFVDDDRLFSFE